MNRRSFLASLLKGTTACMMLPSALTYVRKWKRTGTHIYTLQVNPEWVNAPYEETFLVLTEGVLNHYRKALMESPGMPAIRYTCVDGVWKRIDPFLTPVTL